MVANGGSGESSFSLDWDNIWRGEAKIYKGYWVAEIAIPLNPLRFNEGQNNWNINFYRIDSEYAERSTWAPIQRNFTLFNLASLRVGEWEEPTKRSGENISFIPFLAGNYNQNFNEDQDAQKGLNAGFYRELIKKYPTAKFILTERSPESWAESFGLTIYKLVEGRNEAPEKMHKWLNMVNEVLTKTGFPDGLDKDGLMKGFIAHGKAVREVIPEEQLLAFQVKEGWEPLCNFLNVSVPKDPFPRTNNREEFWELVIAGSK